LGAPVFLDPYLGCRILSFLAVANYYYAERAEYLLERIRGLKINNSSIAELRQIGSEHGFLYVAAAPNKCINTSCLNVVFTNNRWQYSLLNSPSFATVSGRLRLRPWIVSGDLELQKGEVIGKVFAPGFFEGRVNPEVEAAAWEERKLERTACAYYPLRRHPGYAFANASNIRSFRAEVSVDTAAKNHAHAFDFSLKCLTSWHKCDQFSELMPHAWADYEEDGRWYETHPDNLAWEVGKPCPC